MNPTDAADRRLTSGQNVRVQSKVGSIVLPVEVSAEMMPGVVSIPHGWGHGPRESRNGQPEWGSGQPGIQLEVAQQHAGASINDLTDHLTIDALCGTAAFSGTPVSVELYTPPSDSV